MSITARHEGLFSGTSAYTFHMLGCGAIGSSAALQLTRMGATHFHLYDYDKVEDVNIGIAQYNMDDINKYKTEALKSHILNINNDCVIFEHTEEFKELWYEDQKDIIILGFDSMKARMDAVTNICSNRSMKVECIIDGRMGAEHYQQYIITKPTLSKYKKIWYSDENGSDEPCNAKATGYCSNMSGSFIANAVRKFITNSPLNDNFSFNFPTMMLTKNSS